LRKGLPGKGPLGWAGVVRGACDHLGVSCNKASEGV